MKDTIYLTLSEKGVQKMYKTSRFDLRGGQHAVRVNVEVEDRFFRQITPEATLKIGPDHVISPDVAVALDDTGEGDERLKDPGEYVNELADRALDGEPVKGLPDWAFHALVAKLEERLDTLPGRVDSRLEEVPGEDEAVRVVRVVRGD